MAEAELALIYSELEIKLEQKNTSVPASAADTAAIPVLASVILLLV